MTSNHFISFQLVKFLINFKKSCSRKLKLIFSASCFTNKTIFPVIEYSLKCIRHNSRIRLLSLFLLTMFLKPFCTAKPIRKSFSFIKNAVKYFDRTTWPRAKISLNSRVFLIIKWFGRDNLDTFYSSLTVNLFLPFARLLFKTKRPLLLLILARNPCLFTLFLLLGWNVLFIVVSPFLIAVN